MFIVAVILIVAMLVWMDSEYEHFGEFFREANLPFIYKINK